MKLTIRRFGNSYGLILPKEAVAKLNVSNGDALFLTEASDGFRVSPYDPEFEKDIELAKGLMKKRRNVLRQLAK